MTATRTRLAGTGTRPDSQSLTDVGKADLMLKRSVWDFDTQRSVVRSTRTQAIFRAGFVKFVGGNTNRDDGLFIANDDIYSF